MSPVNPQWRSLEERADTPQFRQLFEREFPEGATEWFDPVSRRDFLRLMGASLALAGLGACTRQPEEKIYPYAAHPPEQIVPGKPLFYATAMEDGGYGFGLLVESHEGRPTKIEGNPQHPGSLGAADHFAQASILTMYDPERSQVVSNAGQISTWENFAAALAWQLASPNVALRILTGTVTSPTLASVIAEVLQKFPAARWVQYEPVNQDNIYAGVQLAFGRPVETIYRFDRAEVVVSLDTDFLSTGPGRLRYTRDFTANRRVRGAAVKMNRLYVAESTPSLTGAMADHRLAVRPSEVEKIARQLLAGEGVWAKDLQAHAGRSVVVAGEWQPPVVHALAHAINAKLGNIGQTVFYTEPVTVNAGGQVAALRELVGEMQAGKVEVLLIVGGNPVFDAPADLNFLDALKKVKWRAHLGLYDDETSEWCQWHVPAAHFLETWGDVRAFDGTATIQQPLIAPLYGGKSATEFLSAALGLPGRPAHEMVRAHWKAHGLESEAAWQVAVHDGVVPGTAAKEWSIENRGSRIDTAKLSPPSLLQPPASTGLEILLRPDPTIGDGRWANNGWLQELPKPFTRLTWDNAALLSPRTAEQLGLRTEQVVELGVDGRAVQLPVWVLPGQADDCVTVHFGYGRRRAGRVGNQAGVDVFRLRTSAAWWQATGATLRATGRKAVLACTQHHQLMEGRELVRVGTLEEYQRDPEFVKHRVPEPPGGSLYPPHPYEGAAWGMVIDLNACTGCNACVVACQSENNIPVVGKDQVLVGREMHWIRVDRYFAGDPAAPLVYHQPVPCMHCENAPCEPVCPVAATSHSAEGLNEMTYNRCVGTRYCANNCPYKVRRFNFLQYADQRTESLKLMRNPNVTVRMRGVMEKCTYCVQRINAARITAKKENRQVRDGEVVTACQATCPAQAIIFGDLNDPLSNVSRWRAEKLNYGLLVELNTAPRTTYLAKLRNPATEI